MTHETLQSDGTIAIVPNSTEIRATIARLETAPRDVLTTEWRKAYRSAPPKGASRQFLFAAVAHSLQLKQHGISATKLRRRLERHERRQDGAPKPKQRLAPGARLIRAWNGSTHTVDVTDDGWPFASLMKSKECEWRTSRSCLTNLRISMMVLSFTSERRETALFREIGASCVLAIFSVIQARLNTRLPRR